MTKTELKRLHDIKNALIDKSSCRQIGEHIYCFHIAIEDWHKIFHTDECNEQGITFKRKHR